MDLSVERCCAENERDRLSFRGRADGSTADCTTKEWAASSAGRAPRSQCGGREFDPPAVHQPSLNVHAKVARRGRTAAQGGSSTLSDARVLNSSVDYNSWIDRQVLGHRVRAHSRTKRQNMPKTAGKRPRPSLARNWSCGVRVAALSGFLRCRHQLLILRIHRSLRVATSMASGAVLRLSTVKPERCWSASAFSQRSPRSRR